MPRASRSSSRRCGRRRRHASREPTARVLAIGIGAGLLGFPLQSGHARRCSANMQRRSSPSRASAQACEAWPATPTPTPEPGGVRRGLVVERHRHGAPPWGTGSRGPEPACGLAPNSRPATSMNPASRSFAARSSSAYTQARPQRRMKSSGTSGRDARRLAVIGRGTDVRLEAHLRVALVEGDDLARSGVVKPHDAAGRSTRYISASHDGRRPGHALDDAPAEHALHAAVGERHRAGDAEVQNAPTRSEFSQPGARAPSRSAAAARPRPRRSGRRCAARGRGRGEEERQRPRRSHARVTAGRSAACPPTGRS